MNLKLARDFFTRCFSPGETIALLLRCEDPAKVTQRIVKLEAVITSRYLAWLAHENAGGANIYIAANPLRSGSRKRTKESIATVRHLYIDLDTDGDTRLAALRASNDVPAPTAILSTSASKYQVLWRVESFDFDQQENTLKLLAIAFGGDSACTDRNRVLRVPGFRNCKYDLAYLVRVEYPSNSIYHSHDFRLDDALLSAVSPRSSAALVSAAHKKTHSEQDWAWVVQHLSLGEDAEKLTLMLASRRSDKANPLYYAQRTIDIASARLLLLEGMAIPEVIAQMERRRFTDVPSVLCSSRAREIVTTAMRMIARTTFASIHRTKENHNAPA